MLKDKNLLKDFNIAEFFTELTPADGAEISGGKSNTWSTSQEFHLKLCSGDSIVIPLQGNITTGYKWEIGEINSNLIELQNLEYIPYPNKANHRLVGTGGTWVYTLKTKGSGLTKLQFRHLQPWEKHSFIEQIDGIIQIELC